MRAEDTRSSLLSLGEKCTHTALDIERGCTYIDAWLCIDLTSIYTVRLPGGRLVSFCKWRRSIARARNNGIRMAVTENSHLPFVGAARNWMGRQVRVAADASRGGRASAGPQRSASGDFANGLQDGDTPTMRSRAAPRDGARAGRMSNLQNKDAIASWCPGICRLTT